MSLVTFSALHVCMHVCTYLCMSVCLFVCLSVCMYGCMSVYIYTQLFIYLSIDCVARLFSWPQQPNLDGICLQPKEVNDKTVRDGFLNPTPPAPQYHSEKAQ